MEPKKEEAKEASPKKKLVKVRARRTILDHEGKFILPGKVGEVEEDFGKEVTKKVLGHFTFGGERYGQEAIDGRADLTRADYVDQPQT